MPCPSQSSRLITLTILGERYKLWSFSLWSLLHSPFSSLLGPNIRLRILFSNTLSLRSSLNVKDHASQSYSTTGKYYCFIYFPVCLPSKIWKALLPSCILATWLAHPYLLDSITLTTLCERYILWSLLTILLAFKNFFV